MKIRIKKLKNNAIIPTRGSLQAAGYDLYACLDSESVEIEPHKTVKIGTGLSVEVPDGYFGAIFARSGLAAKQGLRPANCVGVADSDYRGEIGVIIINHGHEPFTIKRGDRIAQMVINKYEHVCWTETDSLDETERGSGGFGHSGV